MTQLGSHGRGEGEMLGRCGRVPAPGQGKSQPEVRIVVARARLHDLPEIVRGLRVPPRVKLCPGESLKNAPRSRLSFRGTLEKLCGGRRAAPAQQVKPPAVPRVGITVRSLLSRVAVLISTGSGIVVAARCF